MVYTFEFRSFRSIFALIGLFLLVLAIPFTAFLASQEQNPQKHASEYVTIISPLPDERVEDPTVIKAAVLGYGKDLIVEFSIDGRLAASLGNEPFVYEWRNIPSGMHAISIRAYDGDINIGTKTITVYKE